MTISSTTRKAGPFNGNGVTTSFPFTFKVFAKSDIAVVRTMPSGIEKTLVLNSDYSVALNGDQDANPGGTITYPISGTPLPTGWRLTAIGTLGNIQPTDITNGGGFYPQVIENALDRVTMLIQQLDEEVDRTIRIAVSDDSTEGLKLPAQDGRATRILGFDADGNFTTYERATATAQTTYRKFTATAGQTVFSLPNTYTPGANSLYVWLNGAKLISGVDFSETTSTSFTLTTGAQAGDSIEAIAGVPLASGTVADSSQVTYTPAGAGAVARTAQAKMRDIVSVKDFGAVGDGVTNDTAALVAAAAALQSGQTLDFGNGTYLISYQGAPYNSVYGNVVMDFLNKTDIGLVGNGATIKVVNHNIATYGGLRFANFKGCKRVHIEGFNFDMTFTGVNTSPSYYPFCGAITALDEDAATPDFNTLNSDFLIERCTFKLFHPYGNWALSGTSYGGDTNNGYKLYSIFVSGPHTPTSDQYLCRNITVKDCTWRDGHNGYGIWLWAWMNCRVEGCITDSWVTKHSNAAGAYQGGGVAFIRNIPFWAHGIVVQGNQFRARPSADRSGDFAGIAQFYVQANNMGGAGSGKGETIIDGNNIILGTGYSTHLDQGIFHNDFGNLIVTSNNFDGHDGQAIVCYSEGIHFAPAESGGNGECTLLVSGNTFGGWLLGSNIYFANGSDTGASDRRCRSLVVTNNISRNGDFFLRMAGYSYKTYEGCPYTVITDNVIDGTRTSSYPPPSVNNYGIVYAANVAGDVGIIANNVFINKTEAIKTETAYCSSVVSLRRYGNSYYGITTPYNADNVFPVDRLEIPQIKFPGTPTLSTDANTLDDYEEGTFTPTIIGTGTAGTGTYTKQIGRYQKIGNRVYFAINLSWTGHTGTTNMFVASLPFTCSNTGAVWPCSVIPDGIAMTAGYYMTAYVENNTSQIPLLQVATGSSANSLVPIDTAGAIYISGHYEV